MKRKTLFLTLLIGLVGLTGCRNNASDGICTVKIHSTYSDYPIVHLQKPGGEMVDSTLRLTNDTLSFVRRDTRMPYIAFLRLINPGNTHDWLELPVAIEAGEVQVDLGDVVKLSGTRTNKHIQKFLNEREKMRQDLHPSTDDMKAALAEVETSYSAFYCKHILDNADNIFGRFIYNAYGSHLTKDDRAKVETKMGKEEK